MLSYRFAAPRGLVVAFVIQVVSCSAETPPPAPRSASALARTNGGQRGARTPTGTTSTALGDSALEPAAVDAMTAEDWPRAESLYRELSRRQPRNPAGKRGLGVALSRQQKSDEAISAFEDSLRLGDDAQTRLELAAAFGAVGRYPSALPHLRKAVQMEPRKPSTWKVLADTLVKVEKPEAAAEALQESKKACTGCPSDEGWNRVTDDVARAAIAKADKQMGAGDTPGARKSVDVALGLRANLPEGHLALGKVARAEGKTKEATDAFRKAVKELPDARAEPGAGARLELAALLLGAGDGAEAVKLAEQVVAVRSEDGVALDTLGRACEATRDTECARKAYTKLAKLPAGDAKTKGAVEHARLRMKQMKPRRR